MNLRGRFSAALVIAALSLATATAQDKIDAALPSLVSYVQPLFPMKLSAASITHGYAIVAFTLRTDGRIDDAVVLEASYLEFGDAVIAVMPTWLFKSSDTSSRREVLRFVFQAQSVLMSLSYLDGEKKQFLTLGEPRAIRTILRSQLSSPPQRVTAAATAVRTSGEGGKAAISFVIDTEGRVRVPMVVEATNPQLGRAALDTVKQWRFIPPMYDDAPVLVEDLRTLTFAPTAERP